MSSSNAYTRFLDRQLETLSDELSTLERKTKQLYEVRQYIESSCTMPYDYKSTIIHLIEETIDRSLRQSRETYNRMVDVETESIREMMRLLE